MTHTNPSRGAVEKAVASATAFSHGARKEAQKSSRAEVPSEQSGHERRERR
jgi:hypothetical protein